MRVSIVMAARDAEQTIGEAVASALAQTHEDWELVVVDDGSTDGTATAASASGDPRIRTIRREPIGVLGAVRNVGVAAATGDVVAFLDADDVWLPRKLELQVDRFRQDPAIGVVHTAADLLVDGVRRPGPVLHPRGPLLLALLRNNFVYSSSAAIRTSLLRDAGGFDPDPRLGGSPDYDLWLRLAARTEFAFLDEVLLLYRVHGSQMSGRRTAMQRSALVALEKLRERDPETVRRLGASYALAAGMRRQLAGEPDRGKPDLLYALRRRPWSPAAWRWLLRALLRLSAAA